MNKILSFAVAVFLFSCGDSKEKQKVIEKQVNLVSQDSTDFIIAFYYMIVLKKALNIIKKLRRVLIPDKFLIKIKFKVRPRNIKIM